jgi:23S rRNA U2552 (ribose-2'-O)-methylase RlmE/FtsJ
LKKKDTAALAEKAQKSTHSNDLLRRLNSLASGQPESEKHSAWILQLSPETKSLWEKDFLASLFPSKSPIPLGGDFYSLSFDAPVSSQALLATIFPRWICPLQHQWPVNPRSEKFVERAATGLQQKLGLNWTGLQILSTSPELKRITIGLKGRLLQLQKESIQHTSELQDGGSRQLVVLLHKKGICAGLSSGALALGSALAGGLGFLKTPEFGTTPETFATSETYTISEISVDLQTNTRATLPAHETSKVSPSRAGGKIREILLLLKELNITSQDYPNWLELGAAPGGMTKELLRWGARVTAVDLADLAPQVQKDPGVTLWKKNATEVESAREFSAILCDMNGPTFNSAQIVARLIATLSRGSLIVHTLKVAQLETLKSSIAKVSALFEDEGAKVLAVRHLFHNRKEVTLVAVKQ